jgi:hypothetical protein
MSFYYVVLFFHISGALILFMGLSLEWVGISRLNSAVNPEQAGDWVKFLSSLKVAFISGGTLLLITGIYLAAARWGWTAWIIVSFLLWLFLTIHGSVVTGAKVKKFSKFLTSASDMTAADLSMYISKLKLIKLLQSRLVIGLGAVFIMTVKPKIAGSIIVVLIAVILGFLPLLTKQKTTAPN